MSDLAGAATVQHDAELWQLYQHRLLLSFLTKREQFHSTVLTQSVSLFNEETRARLGMLAQHFLSHAANLAAFQHQAVIAAGMRIQKQAHLAPCSDVFMLLGAALLAALAVTTLLHKPIHAGTKAGIEMKGLLK